MKKMYFFWVPIAVILFFYWRDCTIRYTKLGESTFLKSSELELKVITRHEQLPLHFIGDAYSIVCKSKNTEFAPERKSEFIDKGWEAVPIHILKCALDNGIKCDHKILAEEAKKYYLLFDKNTLVALTGFGLSISFDGCKTFHDWDLKNLPVEVTLTNSAEFNDCKKRQRDSALTDGDCLYNNFLNQNELHFTNIVASDSGSASFQLESAAFNNKGILNFKTIDLGKTWLVVPPK